MQNASSAASTVRQWDDKQHHSLFSPQMGRDVLWSGGYYNTADAMATDQASTSSTVAESSGGRRLAAAETYDVSPPQNTQLHTATNHNPRTAPLASWRGAC